MLFNFTFYSSVSVFFILLYTRREFVAAKTCVVIYALLVAIWLWIVLSFREPAGDPWRYMQELKIINNMDFYELITSNKGPLGFRLLNWLTSAISTSSEFFFSVIYLFCVIPLYRGLREKFNTFDSSVLLMIYLLYPFYLIYLGSGFKQGISFGFSLWGINCLIDRNDRKWIKGVLLLFLSTLFHSAFWLVNFAVAALFLFFRKRTIEFTLVVLMCCVSIAVLGLVEPIATAIIPKPIIDSLGFNEYFDNSFYEGEHFRSLNYKSGFRIDFTVFTLLPVFMIVFLWKKNLININCDLVKLYCLLASAYFMLCFIPFSDRIANLSWFLIPLLLYSQLSNSKFSFILQNYIVIGFIAFYPLLLLTYSSRFFE
ncbi:EpsG family protein [Endozoicomonas sp. SESOKO1]|uniref:EpsG family protein n=1 Tax=Endozoicomonas sp. SESOKO1 TaxID=2828742 RepID=UPI002148623D|nr:EpsG family protein [Endozoicomonas sp. SESOKO1]